MFLSLGFLEDVLSQSYGQRCKSYIFSVVNFYQGTRMRLMIVSDDVG